MSKKTHFWKFIKEKYIFKLEGLAGLTCLGISAYKFLHPAMIPRGSGRTLSKIAIYIEPYFGIYADAVLFLLVGIACLVKVEFDSWGK